MDLPELIELVPEVSPDETLAAVREQISQSGTKIAAVIQDRQILGIIVERDLARHEAFLAPGTAVPRAREVMINSVEKMPASTPVIDAAREMRLRRIQVLALVDDGGDFVGIVTLRRVLFEVMDELDLKVDNLERELMADGPGG